MKKQYKCPNVVGCETAALGIQIEIDEGKDPVCPECGTALNGGRIGTKAVSFPWKKAGLVLGLTAVVVAALWLTNISFGKEEVQPEFEFSPANPVAGQLIIFHSKFPDATSWVWDFQNDGLDEAFDESPTYSYPDPGDYEVRLTLNGNPNLFVIQKIHVDSVVRVHPEERTSRISVTSKAVMVGEMVTFLDETPGAESWSWDFDADGEPDATERKATFSYEKAGVYTVNVTIDGVIKDKVVITVTQKEKPLDWKPMTDKMMQANLNEIARCKGSQEKCHEKYLALVPYLKNENIKVRGTFKDAYKGAEYNFQSYYQHIRMIESVEIKALKLSVSGDGLIEDIWLQEI